MSNAVSNLATKTYVDNAVDGLASESYVVNAVKDLATKEELEESAVNQATQTSLNSHTNNSTVHITAAERTSWNGKVDQSTYSSHTGNTTAHVTAAERTSWNAKVSAAELEDAVEGIESSIANIVNGTTKVGKASQADSATSATKATQDGAGNNIVSTYSTKVEVEAILAGIESGETATGNAAALGGETSTEWQTKIDAKANKSSLDTHIGNTTVHITATERTTWNEKVSQDELQEAIDGITDGTTIVAKATDANTLDGKDSTYFAAASSVTNIVNGTTTVPNADMLDGFHASSFLSNTGGTATGNICTDKGTTHTRFEVRRTQSDNSIISSRFYSGSNKDLNISVFASIDDADERHCLRMNDDMGLHYRQNAGKWQIVLHTGNSAPCVVVATDPGIGASVSYANGTLLFVKGA